MSTIHPPNEAAKGAHHFLYPLWYITVYEKESHTNGETYYIRAATGALGVARAVTLHPTPFEKVTVEECTWGMDRESGYGLNND